MQVECRFFKSGYCRNGEACPYLHDTPIVVGTSVSRARHSLCEKPRHPYVAAPRGGFYEEDFSILKIHTGDRRNGGSAGAGVYPEDDDDDDQNLLEVIRMLEEEHTVGPSTVDPDEIDPVRANLKFATNGSPYVVCGSAQCGSVNGCTMDGVPPEWCHECGCEFVYD
jgi:hypothetical protein